MIALYSLIQYMTKILTKSVILGHLLGHMLLIRQNRQNEIPATAKIWLSDSKMANFVELRIIYVKHWEFTEIIFLYKSLIFNTYSNKIDNYFLVHACM